MHIDEPRIGMDIERGAGLTGVDSETVGPILKRYRPFDREDEDRGGESILGWVSCGWQRV